MELQIDLRESMRDYLAGLLRSLDVSAGLDRPHQPIGLLTRGPLPDLPQFPLFLDSGKVTMATTKNFQTKLAVNEAVLDYLTISVCPTVSLAAISRKIAD